MHATAAAPEKTHTEKPHRDNIFGICNAIGEDFGFNPFFLRLGFAVALLASPEITLATYAGLGVLVLVSRLATRRWRSTKPATEQPWSPTIPAIRIADRIDASKILEPAL